jgi:hypothetical protein
VVADFCFQIRVRRDRAIKITRTKWWKLKGDTFQVFKDRFIAEDAWNVSEDANSILKEMMTRIQKVVEVFKVIRGNKREPKSTWW